MKKAIFLDKDGTLIENVPQNVNPSLIRLKEKTINGLKTFQEFGYSLIIVTNQEGVASGMFAERDLAVVHNTLAQLMEKDGVALSDFYYCPHDVNGSVNKYALRCRCHKPEPGMILKAAHKNQIDLFHSWVIGDQLSDVEAGNRAGCNTILLNSGRKPEGPAGKYRQPKYVSNNIDEAARWIIQQSYLNSIYQ